MRIPVEAEALQIIKGLVIKGIGATILPMAAVHREIEDGQLIAWPVVNPDSTRELVIARPLGRRASIAIQQFEKVLRDEVASMVRERIWEGRLLP